MWGQWTLVVEYFMFYAQVLKWYFKWRTIKKNNVFLLIYIIMWPYKNMITWNRH